MPMPPALAFYLFFAWFSVAPQLLFLASGITGWAGPRDAILYSIAWLLLPAVLPRRAWPYAFGLVAVVMGICALTKLGNFLVFQQELSQSVFVAIFESNPQESGEFLQQFFRWWMVPIGILFCWPAWWLYRRSMATTLTMRSRSIYAAVALLFIFQPFLVYGNSPKSWDRLERHFATIEPWGMVQNFAKYQDNLRESASLQANMEAAARDAVIHSKDPAAEQTYVLVIGESTSRRRLSLYGYPRQTSPRLQEIRNELLVYDNVVANIPYTIEALSTTLTFTNPEKLNEAFRNMNLLTMMKKAGFKTYWITNQQTLTQRNTMLTAFARLCDERVFLNNNRRQNSSSYDEVVLEPFAKALTDPSPRKLIVVHLLGAHFAYQYRYPENFAVFDKETPPTGLAQTAEQRLLYNQYDNAVRYNDHVVRELIDSLRARDPYGFLLYFADHGEEVFDVRDFNGRNMGNPTVNMYEVPFLLWPSPRWSASRDMQALAATVNRPVSLSSLMHGWCSLASIDYNQCKSQKSLFSQDFVAQQRWVGVGKDRHAYDELVQRDKLQFALQEKKENGQRQR